MTGSKGGKFSTLKLRHRPTEQPNILIFLLVIAQFTHTPSLTTSSTVCTVFVCTRVVFKAFAEVTDNKSHTNIKRNLHCIWSIALHLSPFRKWTCALLFFYPGRNLSPRYSSEFMTTGSIVHHLPVSLIAEWRATLLSLHLPLSHTHTGFQPRSYTPRTPSSLQHCYGNNSNSCAYV